MPRIVLHIGAHKTATTYMQKKLADNRQILAGHNIHYDPLDVMRDKFTPMLNNFAKVRQDYLDELRARFARQDVVISDENIIGMPGDLVRKGSHYADAHDRVKTVMKVLGLDRPEIHMALREYGAFTVSMYSENLRFREFISFGDYLDLHKKARFSWLNVVEDVRRAAPGAKIVLWDFGQFRQAEHAIFTRMLGFDARTLVSPEGPVRESFSEKAVQAFEALSTILDRGELKKLIGPISRHLPKGDTYKGFSPLGNEDKTMFREQYAQDLAAIAAKHPDIEFVTS